MTTGAGLLARGSADFVTPGLRRFTWAHAISAAADAAVTVSLAGSLFFSVSPDASRQQVLTYLIVTMAPFVVLAPLIGPAIDRFRRGHRWIAVIIYVVRAGLAVALAFALFTLFFYALALALLVCSKASSVLKSALVPGLVDDTASLVSANSRLARVTTIIGGIGGATAAGVATLTVSSVPLFGAAALFLVSASLAARLPHPRFTDDTDDGDERPDLQFKATHRPLITASAAAYTVIRFAVGAFIFGLAFALRRSNEPAWMYGAAALGYGAGAYLGNVIAPLARRRFGEDRLLAGALVGLAVCATFAAAGASRILVVTVAAMMGLATTFGRQGFDSLVQRHAPRALHARSFSRFETQFQLGWVIGAAAATGAALSAQFSLLIVAVVLVPSSAWYLASAREARRFDVSTANGRTPDASRAGASDVGDGVDDVDVAIAGHLVQADRWVATGRWRLATVELTAATELLRAAGSEVPGEVLDELAELRRTALTPRGDGDSVGDDDATGPTASRLTQLIASVRATTPAP